MSGNVDRPWTAPLECGPRLLVDAIRSARKNYMDPFKKNHQQILKTKKVGATFGKFLIFFRSKIFENFHWNLYENQKKWDKKIRKFSISKISFFIQFWMKIFYFFWKFFDLKNFENFHSKLYEKWKFWDRKKSKIFDLFDQTFSRFCESIFLIFFFKIHQFEERVTLSTTVQLKYLLFRYENLENTHWAHLLSLHLQIARTSFRILPM